MTTFFHGFVIPKYFPSLRQLFANALVGGHIIWSIEKG